MAQTGAESKPVFAIAPYEADADGLLRVVLPQRCVHAQGSEQCSLHVDHYRARKTGPGFPVAVVCCSCHKLGRYTLYPPGHIPYGRQAVVGCSASGPLLREGCSGPPVWQGTLFGAAVDAAAGRLWPDDSPSTDERRRRTQGCRLELTGSLLGVHAAVNGRTREHIATRLEIPTMTLLTAAANWCASWKLRGAAIVAVLVAVVVDDSLLDRMLVAGALAGLWPSPERWDRHRQRWVRRRSRQAERPRCSASRQRAPPPTNSPAALPVQVE